MAPLTADTGMNIGGLSYGNADGDYLPIVKVAPIYPRRALTRGLEGWVLLEFTVTKLGTVVDIKVLESDPPGIFDKAAVGAAAKFKYKPKVVNGEPIDTAGVLHRISFELED
jgi:protein TonB